MRNFEIVHLNEIDSTNDYVKTNISDLKNLTAVYTDRQTNGRGRLDRKWIDTGKDNLYLTIVLKPFNELNPIYQNFTQYLSVILSMVIEEEYGLNPKIKWPNDVTINGKKIAGILSEGATKGNNFLGLALGVGINLNTTPEILAKIDKPATSIFTEIGRKINKEIFLEKLLTKFCLLYDRYVCEGFPSIKDEYKTRTNFLGKEITINVLGELHTGIVEGLTDDGALLLKEDLNTNIYYIGDIL